MAREFELSRATVRNWAIHGDIDKGLKAERRSTAERAELRELRRENRQLKLEREALAMAAA